MTDYDSPATFRGQLRRGRGIAVQRAKTEPNAAEAVYECVCEDLRWDLPCDERDSYLAGLLPFVGRSDAASLLKRYAVEGQYRQLALEAIGGSGAFRLSGYWDGLAETVAAAYDDDQLKQAIGYFGGDPWRKFAESQPRIRPILDEVTASRNANPRPKPEYQAQQQQISEASFDDLIQAAATGNQNRAHALTELGRRGEQRVLDLAEEICRDDSPARIPGMPQALGHLGRDAVPRARIWSAGENRTLARLAVRVLSEHGDTDDATGLHTALNDYVSAGDWCAAETPARGLGRLGVRDAADDLMAAWEATPHSLARVDFLQALIGCHAPWAETCAEEGLFDCQPEVQHIACTVASDSAGVRRRLREIAADPLVPQAHEPADARLRLLSEPRSAD